MVSSNPLARLADGVVQASPWAMLACYAAFSFSIWNLLPDKAFNVVWYIFATAQTVCAFVGVSIAINSRRPSVLARRHARKAAKEGFTDLDKKRPSIDVILIPQPTADVNDIVEGLQYVVDEVNYPRDKLHVYVARDLTHIDSRWSNVQSIPCPPDASESDIISQALYMSNSPIVSIYTAGAVPDPNAFAWVARRFNEGKVDVVHGRRCISNPNPSALWSHLASVDYDVCYGVFQPGTPAGTTAWGCDGHWSRSLLKALIRRHRSGLDSSVRALLSGARCGYDLNVVAFEAAPWGLSDLMSQRVAWAREWTRITGRHSLAFSKTSLALVLGALYPHVLFQFVCLMFASLPRYAPADWKSLYHREDGFVVSVWLFAFQLMAGVVGLSFVYRNRSASTPRTAVLVFAALSPLYLVAFSLLLIAGHFKALVRAR